MTMTDRAKRTVAKSAVAVAAAQSATDTALGEVDQLRPRKNPVVVAATVLALEALAVDHRMHLESVMMTSPVTARTIS